jgi:hypothetical protein
MLKRTYFVIMVFLAFATLTFAQPSVQWIRYFNARGNEDVGTDVAVTAGNGVLVCGWYKYNDTGTDVDGPVLKFRADGTRAGLGSWNEFTGIDKPVSIVVLSNGKAYMAGDTKQGTDYDFGTISVDTGTAGVGLATLWNSSGSQNDWAQVIRAGAADTVYVGGTFKTTSTLTDLKVLKYYAPGGGATLITTGPTYNYANLTDTMKGMVVDANYNVYVIGKIDRGTGASYDWITIKYNRYLVKQWDTYYAGPGGVDDPTDIAVDASGNVYVCGIAYDNVSGNNDIKVVKYNSSGTQQWVKSYNGGDDVADALFTDGSYVYVAGHYGAYIVTEKWAVDGTAQWTTTYSNSSSGYAVGVKADLSNNVYVGGAYAGDLTVLSYDASGTLRTGYPVSTPGVYSNTESAKKMVVDHAGDIIIAGTANTMEWPSIGDDVSDYVVAKFAIGASFGSQARFVNVGLGEEPVNQVREFRLDQNYPNPFNPQTNIRFNVSLSGVVSLKVYDMLGRLVSTVIDGQFFEAGQHEVAFNGARLATGVYFYRLENELGKVVSTKRMLLVK